MFSGLLATNWQPSIMLYRIADHIQVRAHIQGCTKSDGLYHSSHSQVSYSLNLMHQLKCNRKFKKDLKIRKVFPLALSYLFIKARFIFKDRTSFSNASSRFKAACKSGGPATDVAPLPLASAILVTGVQD